jgi:hypothetical protein
MIGALNDESLAPDAALWQQVLAAVRVAVMRGPFPEADFSDWEDQVRGEGRLAVEALRLLNDASTHAHAGWASRPSTLTSAEVEMIDEARAALRGATLKSN